MSTEQIKIYRGGITQFLRTIFHRQNGVFKSGCFGVILDLFDLFFGNFQTFFNRRHEVFQTNLVKRNRLQPVCVFFSKQGIFLHDYSLIV